MSVMVREVKVVTSMTDILQHSNCFWTPQGQRPHLFYLSIFGAFFSALNTMLLSSNYMIEGSTLKLKEAILRWGRKEENQSHMPHSLLCSIMSQTEHGRKSCFLWLKMGAPALWNNSRCAEGGTREGDGAHRRGMGRCEPHLVLLLSFLLLGAIFSSLARLLLQVCKLLVSSPKSPSLGSLDTKNHYLILFWNTFPKLSYVKERKFGPKNDYNFFYKEPSLGGKFPPMPTWHPHACVSCGRTYLLFIHQLIFDAVAWKAPESVNRKGRRPKGRGDKGVLDYETTPE